LPISASTLPVKGRNGLDFNESVVLARAVEGDSEAFGLLYVYYRTGNIYDAEDLTERVFFRALRHIGKYNHRGLPFSAWLYRIAHNLVANWYRDNSRRKEIPLDDSMLVSRSSSHPEYELLQTEEQERLLIVIRGLPPDRQQLLILKYVDHLSNAEIGQIMGRTEGAVNSLYHRTLIAIRDELGARSEETGNDSNFENANGGHAK
jgi:RNA polymerase sigma-70 factor (ECF subfamily)